ncbi:CDC48 family AAA ATPase [Ectothiorhodospira variabilis]|uniref:CDC48 family AAA ATPase n=1 Tax=Ectothiorhodospira variabilis TaxID=505694 RepID=UPI001EFB7B28|nr:CDC48 family AAA ATPase [Ectothiorhodospira variabilis]MCG5495762.1 CDC48 family AAA ATPase [Ectothiorhodospira variabilis]MCG5505211.1 CDC48 family AAA ATPase [Ectothiorhodospira variabilis]MCG5508352.1 CDC48 family AAA ATPase [Ectothiorhodospira variabilis]
MTTVTSDPSAHDAEGHAPATDRLSLRVGDAAKRDAGRAIARIDPVHLPTLGCQIGDVVKVVGQRTTVCRIMPAFKDARDPARVQLDGISRTNVGAALDDTVTLQRVEAPPARSITLQPTDVVPQQRDMKYIGSLLDGTPVVRGDRVRATLFGNRHAEFVVRQTAPQGPVCIGPTTRLTVNGATPGKQNDGEAQPSASGLTYEDVGGIGPVVHKVREMVELPLRHPEIFEKLGIDPPKGVLLHGTPGTGKTLVARAVANETEAHFLHISGPEIIGKFYGESEAKLRQIFDEAQRRAPSIIFIDEIDAIAPKREDLGGEKQVERRVVAQLLALLDGLEGRGKVIVIAATNLPNLLDPALRRPGRFDREIVIPVPDQPGRLQILEIHSRGMPLAEDVDLNDIAALTSGYVGADLEALCREAAMACLRRVFPQIDLDMEDLSPETLMALEVRLADFDVALHEVEPSALREVFVEVPNTRWDDVGGLEDVKDLLQEAIEWPVRYKHLFRKAGIHPPKGILLSGPPGCGKTLLAQASAQPTEMNFISVKGAALLSRYVGESEAAVREVFRKARQVAPCLVFFDEVDALVPARGGGENAVADRVVGQFLAELDGVEQLTDVLVLAATNRPDRIDPALLRPGRFDLHVKVPVPDSAARLAILRVHTRDKQLAGDVDLEQIVTRTEGFSGADLASVCQRAAMEAVRECVARGVDHCDCEVILQTAHFDEVLESMKR